MSEKAVQTSPVPERVKLQFRVSGPAWKLCAVQCCALVCKIDPFLVSDRTVLVILDALNVVAVVVNQVAEK